MHLCAKLQAAQIQVQKKKKKKNFTSFCQPTRLITCATEWQEGQVILFTHEVKAINNEVKDPHVILLSKECPHTISTTKTLMWYDAMTQKWHDEPYRHLSGWL